MKKWHIALIILFIVLIAIPAFGKRGRKKATLPGPKLAFSLYGGAENLNGEVTPMDSSMYMGFGANLIMPLWRQLGFRLGLVTFEMPEDVNYYGIGTGVGGDFMYYFPMPMMFVPYGFGGLWYYGSSGDNYSSTDLIFRGGLGGEIQMAFPFFVEAGIDFHSWSVDVGGVESDDSYMPIFVHGGIRIPLFQ
jgi:hypothetical protein